MKWLGIVTFDWLTYVHSVALPDHIFLLAFVVPPPQRKMVKVVWQCETTYTVECWLGAYNQEAHIRSIL